MVRQVIIIGSGPAGHTAAIYAARANLKPLMFEGLARGGIPGGQLMITNDVENYPGFPEKITGPDLMKAFREQSIAQGVEIVTDDVEQGRPLASGRSPSGPARRRSDEHRARTLIIATGAQAKWLGLESEAALQGKGVSACAVCDGAFFRNQDVIVVGGGDTAMEEAMYLSGLCRTVTLVHRRDEFRASKTMQERVVKNPKIKLLYNTVIEEVLDVSKGEVTGARVRTSRRTRRTSSPRRASSSPSATPRTPTSSRASSSCTTTATSGRGPGARTRTCPASSPAATCRTSPTGRR